MQKLLYYYSEIAHLHTKKTQYNKMQETKKSNTMRVSLEFPIVIIF